MKVTCQCGTSIPDQTDALPHKAWFVADQDWFDLMETADGLTSHEIRTTLWPKVRIAYQCRECGRIWLNDKSGRLHSFAPDRADGPRDLFTK